MDRKATSDSQYSVESSDEPRIAYRHKILGLCTVGSFFYLAGRIIIPPLAIPIKEGIGIGNTEFGFALTLLWAAYALMQFPGGVTSDEIGHKTVLVGSMVVASLGFALFAIGQTYGMFLLAALITGIGGGLFMIVRFRFLSALYGNSKGRAFGISGGISGLAGVIAPIAITTAIAVVSWRLAFVSLVVLVMGIAGAFHLQVRERYVLKQPNMSKAASKSLDQIISPKIVLMMAVTATYSTTVQAVTSFIPLFMHDVKGMSLAMSGMMLSVYFLIGVVVRPLSGAASDVVGRRRMASSSLILAGVCLWIVAEFVEPFTLVLIMFSLFSVTFLSFSPAMDAYFMDLFDDDSMGGAFGLARTFILVIGSTGPYLVGIGTETIGFTTSFVLLSASMILAGVILLSSTKIFEGSENPSISR